MRVKVFTSEKCKPCELLKDILRLMSIEYEEIDVDKNPSLAKKENVTILPTIIIGDKRIEGVNLYAIREALSELRK